MDAIVQLHDAQAANAYNADLFAQQIERAYEASREATFAWDAVKHSALCARFKAFEIYQSAICVLETTMETKFQREAELLRSQSRDADANTLLAIKEQRKADALKDVRNHVKNEGKLLVCSVSVH